MMIKISYRGYRFPPEIIQHAIWLYFRFTLSFRDVEDLLAERGITVSYETVRRWVNHLGPMVAADLRKRRPKPHTTWHPDEVYLKINGRMVYVWRAVDAEGEVLDVLIQNSGSRTGMNEADGATTEPRIRINRPAGENARCKVSRVRVQPRDFSQPTQPPTILSMFNTISPQQERTEPFARRR
jgi:hypothetical protein